MPFHAGDDRSAKSQIPRIAAIQGVREGKPPQFSPKSQKNRQQQLQMKSSYLNFSAKIRSFLSKNNLNVSAKN